MRTEEGKGRDAAAPPPGGPRERLVVKDPDDMHVLARYLQAMLLGLLADPGKVKELERLKLTVAIEPPAHPGCALTLGFAGGRVVLECGAAPGADIRIGCEPAMLMKLARMPAGRAAFGFLRTHEGRAVVAGLRSGEVKIRGVLRHPLGMMRFSRFLAPSAAREGMRT